jgi:hypothetical protein
MAYSLIRRLQNSPLTNWWWRWFLNDETGEIQLLPWYACPNYPLVPWRKL